MKDKRSFELSLANTAFPIEYALSTGYKDLSQEEMAIGLALGMSCKVIADSKTKRVEIYLSDPSTACEGDAYIEGTVIVLSGVETFWGAHKVSVSYHTVTIDNKEIHFGKIFECTLTEFNEGLALRITTRGEGDLSHGPFGNEYRVYIDERDFHQVEHWVEHINQGILKHQPIV